MIKISLRISLPKFFLVFDAILFGREMIDKALKFEYYMYINFLECYILTNILEIVKVCCSY